MKNIIDSIEGLKPYTDHSIMNIRKANIPTNYELNLERRYSFSNHGFKHCLLSENSLVFLSDNIPFSNNQKRHTFADTLDNLVRSGEVMPFLLFINNDFIKWSNILILKDCKYSYLILIDYKRDVDIHKCILIPQDVKYIENSKIIPKEAIFAFSTNDNRLCSVEEEGKTYTTIELVNTKDIYYECEQIYDLNKLIKTNLPSDKKINKENIFIFNNGYLAPYIEHEVETLNIFKVTSEYEIPNTRNLVYKLFYYNKNVQSKDNIYSVNNLDYISDQVILRNEAPDYVKGLSKSFDFKYDKTLSYEKNIYNTLNYIMKYNSSLLDNIYKQKSNIISKLFTGKQVKANMNKFGFVSMSRRIGLDELTNVIIFVNGELYKAYNELKYKNKDFIIPIIDIKDDDIIEILYFKEVDNRVFKVNFNSNGDDRYIIDSSIDMSKMKLFSMNPHELIFNIERKDSIQYEIEFVYEKMENQIIKIIPEDSFYYDRTLSLASEKQFHYVCKIMKEESINMILPDEFKFCNDIKKYMVFVNGRKIDSNNFKITLPKPTRPFDDLAVYINIVLDKGDKLEIFYVPEAMDELLIERDINLSGTIVIDRSKLAYNLNKDLYMIFINGKKINTNQMTNIDQNRIKLISNMDSIYNLSIIKHVKDDEILSELFKENKDIITEILETLSSNNIDRLYGDNIMSNLEYNIKNNEIPMKSVMYKLIKDYYIKPYIYNGEEFVYDYDTDCLEVDENGNIILGTLDAGLE